MGACRERKGTRKQPSDAPVSKLLSPGATVSEKTAPLWPESERRTWRQRDARQHRQRLLANIACRRRRPSRPAVFAARVCDICQVRQR